MPAIKDGYFSGSGRKRRSWTPDEKRRIVEESLVDGTSIAEVARRHALNANLLFTWRRKMGFEPDNQPTPVPILPVMITPEPVSKGHCSKVAGKMEIVLPEGHRIVVGADVETVALSRVLKALSRR